MKHSETAVNCFKDGYNCAQSVLSTYADRLKITKDFAFRVANGFGAGMGRKQDVCGALTGGILVLNLLYGRGENEDRQKQEDTYGKTRQLMDGFEKKFTTCSCRKLLDGCDLLSPEGQERFKSEKMIEKCHGFVAYTTELLDDILQ